MIFPPTESVTSLRGRSRGISESRSRGSVRVRARGNLLGCANRLQYLRDRDQLPHPTYEEIRLIHWKDGVRAIASILNTGAHGNRVSL
jgi:hypothetical protein